MNIHFMSKSDNWSTPINLFNCLDKQFHFTLDPCANKNNTKCLRFYSKEIDGLSKSWAHETVFMNQPYGREISKWIKKAYKESLEPGTIIVCLIPARTDTTYWHDFVMKSTYIHFIKGRLKFNDIGTAPFPSAIIVFGKDIIDIDYPGKGFYPLNHHLVL